MTITSTASDVVEDARAAAPPAGRGRVVGLATVLAVAVLGAIPTLVRVWDHSATVRREAAWLAVVLTIWGVAVAVVRRPAAVVGAVPVLVVALLVAPTPGRTAVVTATVLATATAWLLVLVREPRPLPMTAAVAVALAWGWWSWGPSQALGSPAVGVAAVVVASASALVGVDRLVEAGVVRMAVPVSAALGRVTSALLRWDGRGAAWVVAGLALLVAVPVDLRLIDGALHFGFNDIPGHVQAAQELSVTPYRIPPHFLFHVSVRALLPVLGVDLATLAVLAFGSVTFALGVWRLAGRAVEGRHPLRPIVRLAVVAFVAIAETPTVLLVALGLADQAPTVAVVHTWASPTDVLALGVTFLWVLPRLLDLVEGRGLAGSAAPRAVTMAALVVLSATAKPSFALGVVPAVAGYLLLRHQLDRVSVRKVLGPLVVGSATALLLQVVVMTVLVAPDIGRSGVAWSSWATIIERAGGQGALLHWAPVLILPLGLWCGGRRYLRDPFVGISLVGVAATWPIMVFLTETGPRASHQNLSRPVSFWWFMAFVAAARFIAVELDAVVAGRGRWPAWAVVATVGAALSMAAGSVVFLDLVGVVESNPWS